MLDQLPSEAEVLARLVAWAQAQPEVRAVLLSSSRARPEPGVDVLSDYDVILAVPDAEAYVRADLWRTAYSQPLLAWGDHSDKHGLTTYFRGVIHTDHVKVDYSFWPLALLARITAAATLPPELDAGYRTLLDKDDLTAGWPAPSYRAFRPTPPSAADFQALVEEFWFGVSYVAKSLWRDELFFARWVLDNDLKQTTLRRLLEWHIALRHGWALRPGVLGRGLRQRLPPDLYAALAATYAGPEPAANWQALERTLVVFRRVALEVAAAFGYTYPEDLERQMRAFVDEVRGWALAGPQ